MSLLRQCLGKCHDEVAAPSTRELAFIDDLRAQTAIRKDLSSTETAYRNAEWKAATVLGGSVIEALLLWSIGQQEDIAALSGVPTGNPDPKDWKARVLISVAAQAKLIQSTSQKYAELARDARDLIHPAKALKGESNCDQSTANGALAAVHSIITDLEKVFSAAHPRVVPTGPASGYPASVDRQQS